MPSGTHPHDVAPARDGGVWYTAQHTGQLGWLNPRTGKSRLTRLGNGSAPHGVIVGPDGAPWITDGGLNAIVRVDPRTRKVRRFPLPASSALREPEHRDLRPPRRALVHGAERDLRAARSEGREGARLPARRAAKARTGSRRRRRATSTTRRSPAATSAGSTSAPAKRPCCDRRPRARARAARGRTRSGRIWISEWNAGKVGMYDPRTKRWREWRVPGANPMIYAVYVDERDKVWLTDFGANALWRFDPVTERFTRVDLPSADAAVRQLLGRRGRGLGRRVRHGQARRGLRRADRRRDGVSRAASPCGGSRAPGRGSLRRRRLRARPRADGRPDALASFTISDALS